MPSALTQPMPSALTQPSVSYCMKLMILREGLQNMTTLQLLDMWDVHDHLIQRFSPNGGQEIKHIPLVKFRGRPASTMTN